MLHVAITRYGKDYHVFGLKCSIESFVFVVGVIDHHMVSSATI